MTAAVVAAVVPAQAGPRDEQVDAGRLSRALASFQLVARFQAGDREAFGEIYEQYHRPVLLYLSRKLGSRAEAEDLAQDVFVRALSRLDRVQWQGADLGAWLVTIARNLAADHFKSARYQREWLSDDLFAWANDRPTDGQQPRKHERPATDDPEQETVDYLTRLELLKALKRLTGEQHEVLVLRFLRGLTVQETARAMGKQEGAIKALQYRAVRALARLVDAEAVR